ncbi:MAG: GAF and ANTAR domain-containing protein [Nocardioidaceae bacterium]
MPEPDPIEFARLAEELQAAPTPTETASEIVDYVRSQLDANHAGVTLIRGGGLLETVAGTDPLVERADQLQYELDEGPCRDSSWHSQTLFASDLAKDPRWPRWAPKVVALGISSVLAAEMTTVEDRRIGAINIYWTQPREFTADDAAFANIFARHAALALAASLNEAGLNVALDSRKLIGQAQGMLMERYDLDEDRAFEVLVRYSQDHNMKLRQVAEHLIATRRLPNPRSNQQTEGDKHARLRRRSATSPELRLRSFQPKRPEPLRRRGQAAKGVAGLAWVRFLWV